VRSSSPNRTRSRASALLIADWPMPIRAWIKQIASIMTIDHIDLFRIDLNLLVALDALLAERSVTRAPSRHGPRDHDPVHDDAHDTPGRHHAGGRLRRWSVS
jgi:hypothetical protein